jgi:tRNA (guanine-N7-)-methyltransferase
MAARPPLAAQDATEIGGGYYGRGKVKKLSDRKEGLLQTLLPRLLVPVPHDPQDKIKAPRVTASIDPVTLFERKPQAIVLEIGFGGGEHLVHRALESPETGFIGVEPFINGMGKALAAVVEHDIRNIRLFNRDAGLLLSALPNACLDRVDVFYPDPWPKRRHNKRRFVNQGSLKAFHRVLSPNGIFRFASDIDDYVGWTLAHVERSQCFDWMAQSAGDWTSPYAGWPGTRYEAKAKREGRVPSYLTFRRR